MKYGRRKKRKIRGKIEQKIHPTGVAKSLIYNMSTKRERQDSIITNQGDNISF